MQISPHAEILRNALKSHAEVLRQRLVQVRFLFKHFGNRGDVAERGLRDVLRVFMPRSHEVLHGEVIDTHGTRSGQTDIVIITDDHPHILPVEGPGLFLVEGVGAMGEVKANLTTDGLVDVIASSRKTKSLRVELTPGLSRLTSPSDAPRFHNRPPYFLFCYESQLSVETIRDRLNSAANETPEDPHGLLDAVFILDRGTVYNLSDGQGTFKVIAPDGTVRKGWYSQESPDALFNLICWLSIVMPRTIRMIPLIISYVANTNPGVLVQSHKL